MERIRAEDIVARKNAHDERHGLQKKKRLPGWLQPRPSHSPGPAAPNAENDVLQLGPDFGFAKLLWFGQVPFD
jgi:hypothetical protein